MSDDFEAADEEHSEVEPTSVPAPASEAPETAAVSTAVGEEVDSPTEAYRFLLSHIDAEIAALQRRQKEVVEKRQKVEQKQSSRIKEIFEYIDQPWLFLESPVPPPLPATGVDVYIKEMTMNKQKANTSEDKMFVLACHKNYRSLDWSDKRPYEQAAEINSRLREEMKRMISTGCSRFEVFCGQIRECTAEMVRRGEVPPPTPAPYQPRPWSKRYQDGKAKASAAAKALEDDAPVEESSKKTVRSKRQKKATVPHIPKPAGKRPKAVRKPKKAPTAKPLKVKRVVKKKPAKASAAPSSVKSIPLPTIDMAALKKRKQQKKTAPSKPTAKVAKKPTSKPKSKAPPRGKKNKRK
ncbi:hypothetical protein AGDE_14112 [Angomonas deanei]|uniref:Uncharacterized protein n=1 Tax=Angomonas deanei TaxID=59799 RepID=A0A7G2C158_9TRYP|nr:hypothetical protein AGDE_14112 [Angomonas deanei]CAD2213498.1 hypothetical protein, conserved [Angomonas deanei]|eukprot:EPY21404.1 hypothetical protein AGDE_14112 [Angomonas deanei]